MDTTLSTLDKCKGAINMDTKNSIAINHDKKKNRKKGLVILLCLSTAFSVVAGSLLAYFSDIFEGSTTITAGTLFLEGTADFYINDIPMAGDPATADELECLNPGDTIVVVFTVTNAGSKSAWAKSFFTLSANGFTGSELSGAFTVYPGAGTSGTPLTVDSQSDEVQFEDNAPVVLNGETETETAATGRTKTMIFTIVFDPTAGNDFQGATIDIDYQVKAIQYRNNPSPDWSAADYFTPTGP